MSVYMIRNEQLFVDKVETYLVDLNNFRPNGHSAKWGTTKRDGQIRLDSATITDHKDIIYDLACVPNSNNNIHP